MWDLMWEVGQIRIGLLMLMKLKSESLKLKILGMQLCPVQMFITRSFPSLLGLALILALALTKRLWGISLIFTLLPSDIALMTHLGIV
jgi:hypothetical protein